MKCFNCGYELNEANAEQCKVCGVRFEHVCNGCGKPNPSLANFCLHCGNDLALDQQDKLEETKRQVAVLFADISGFTKLSEEKDPEEVREIINGAFQAITKPVYELEGTIDKFIGDAVMVLFGAKYAHMDDSFRALQCAMEMRRLIKEYSDEIGITLELSIGINYGIVVTGQVGNYYDKDFTVIGDVVNTAQRLQEYARRSEILVSESVYLDTLDVADYTEAVQVELKNKTEKENVYSPISLSISSDTVSINRTDELKELNEVFISDNKFVTVVGESGMGKSSMVREFMQNIDESIKQVWVNSNIANKSKPFGLISNIINAILNIKNEDSIRIKENRLRSFLDYVLGGLSEEEVVRNYNFLALISNLRLDDDYKNLIHSMEYADLRNEIVYQIKKFFELLSLKQFIVAVVEDIHITDNESRMILNELQYDQFMLIGISQGEIKQFTNSSTVTLDPFDHDKSGQLIENIMSQSIDSSFDELIKLANGIPMLLIELIQVAKKKDFMVYGNELSLKEEAIKQLPSSMTGLVLSKYDELEKEAASFVSVASVVGDEFRLDWMNHLVKMDDDLISELTNRKFIEFRRFTTVNQKVQKVYGFTQRIIQEVAYNNLLNKYKKNIHREVAETIEFYDDYMNHLESIAYHYDKAEVVKKASKFYYLNAEELKRSFNYKSAIDNFLKVQSGSKEYEHSLREAVRLQLIVSDFEEAENNIEEALKLQGEEHINETLLLKATLLKEKAEFDQCLDIIHDLEKKVSKESNLYGRLLQVKSPVYLMTGRPEVTEIAKQSEKILSKQRDYNSLADTMSYAGIASFMKGELDEAKEYLSKGLDYAELSNNLLAVSKISTNLGIIYHASGEVNKSFDILSKAVDAANKVGSVKNYLSAAINLGVFYLEKGLFNKAKPLFVEASIKASTSNLVYQKAISLSNLGDLSVELGEYELAKEYYKESLTISKEVGLKYEEGVNSLALGKLSYLMGHGQADDLLHAFSIFEETEELVNLSDYYRISAEFVSDEPLETIEKAIEYAKKANNELKELQAITVKAVLLKDSGLFDEAKEKASTVDSTYEYVKVLFKEYEVFGTEELKEELEDISDRIDDCLLKKEIDSI